MRYLEPTSDRPKIKLCYWLLEYISGKKVKRRYILWCSWEYSSVLYWLCSQWVIMDPLMMPMGPSLALGIKLVLTTCKALHPAISPALKYILNKLLGNRIQWEAPGIVRKQPGTLFAFFFLAVEERLGEGESYQDMTVMYLTITASVKWLLK